MLTLGSQVALMVKNPPANSWCKSPNCVWESWIPPPCLFLTLFTSPVIHMEKEFAPMNYPLFFPLLPGLTITYQHYWVRSARPKPWETVPSETVPKAPSDHSTPFPQVVCVGLLALSPFRICTFCLHSLHSWPEAKPSNFPLHLCRPCLFSPMVAKGELW